MTGEPAHRRTRSARTAARRRRQRRFRIAAGARLLLVGVLGALGLALTGHGSTHRAAGAGLSAGVDGTSTAAVQAPSPPQTFATSSVERATTGDGLGAVFSDPVTVALVQAAARSDVQTVDSYDYQHLDGATAAGSAVSTGAFRDTYQRAMTSSVRNAASAAHTVQNCTVQRVGVVSLDGSAGAAAGGGRSAQVLVFARLDVTDVESPTVPRSQAVTLGARVQLSGGAWLISDMSDVAAAAPTALVPPGTPGLVAAAQTGVGAALDILSYRRADFDADFARSWAALSAELAVQQRAREQSIRTALATGGYDVVSSVSGAAVESADVDLVTLLVAVHTVHVTTGGTQTAVPDTRFEATVTRSAAGSWQVSSLATVGLS